MPNEIPEPHKSAHDASFRSRNKLLTAKWVGCFFCCVIFKPKMIREWVDDGETALCPLCRIDAVMPITLEQFDSDFLEEMHAHWFDVRPVNEKGSLNVTPHSLS